MAGLAAAILPGQEALFTIQTGSTHHHIGGSRLSAEEVAAVRLAIAQEQARSSRWGLWWSIVIAVVFWMAGVVTQALINFDALGDQLRQWLHLG